LESRLLPVVVPCRRPAGRPTTPVSPPAPKAAPQDARESAGAATVGDRDRAAMRTASSAARFERRQPRTWGGMSRDSSTAKGTRWPPRGDPISAAFSASAAKIRRRLELQLHFGSVAPNKATASTLELTKAAGHGAPEYKGGYRR